MNNQLSLLESLWLVQFCSVHTKVTKTVLFVFLEEEFKPYESQIMSYCNYNAPLTESITNIEGYFT